MSILSSDQLRYFYYEALLPQLLSIEDGEELDIKQVAKYILENFADSNSRGYFKKSELYLEPGKYLISNKAVLLATVTNVKRFDGILVGIEASMDS